MSNIATHLRRKNAFPLLSLTLLLASVSACLPTCAPPLEPLAPGRPVLTGLKATVAEIEEISVQAKLPSSPAWQIRLRREERGGRRRWVFAERSDRPGFQDLADDAFIDHFLETLSTFEAEEKAGEGTDEIFGLAPYRLDVRIRRKDADGKALEQTLLLGDATGLSNAYFRRRADEKETWVGRGAFVSFVGNLREPESFAWKHPYLASHEEVKALTLEKSAEPNAGKWIFNRRFERDEKVWSAGAKDGKPATDAKAVDRDTALMIERLLRQRILGWPDESPAPELLEKADWTIRLETAEPGEETLDVYFVLDRIYARNPKRTPRLMELYPEFAGTLRAFTQLRSTQVKSGTK
jgi:hypothetical protein